MISLGVFPTLTVLNATLVDHVESRSPVARTFVLAPQGNGNAGIDPPLAHGSRGGRRPPAARVPNSADGSPFATEVPKRLPLVVHRGSGSSNASPGRDHQVVERVAVRRYLQPDGLRHPDLSAEGWAPASMAAVT